MVRSQARVTKPTVKGGLAPANAAEVKGRGCRGRALPRQLAWRGPIQRRNSFTPKAREGTSTGASVTAPLAGRFSASGCELAGANLCIDRCSFLPISLDRSCAAWRQDSVHTPMQPAMGSRASGRLSGCHRISQPMAGRARNSLRACCFASSPSKKRIAQGISV